VWNLEDSVQSRERIETRACKKNRALVTSKKIRSKKKKRGLRRGALPAESFADEPVRHRIGGETYRRRTIARRRWVIKKDFQKKEGKAQWKLRRVGQCMEPMGEGKVHQ